MTQQLYGLPAASGIGIGTLFVYTPVAEPLHSVSADVSYRPNDEWQRFLSAQAKVDAELEQLGKSDSPSVADIFEGHRTLLQDKSLVDAIRTAIYEQGVDASTATYQTINELADLFHTLEDPYFSSRATDIVDIGQRILSHLEQSSDPAPLIHLPPRTILVASELTPTTIIELPIDKVMGLVLVDSTPTAHAVILARSMGLPVICALDATLLDIPTGEQAVIDGNTGLLLIQPSQADILNYTDRQQYMAEQHAASLVRAHLPATTQDEIHIPVYANINSMEAVTESVTSGADGIGLLRTEMIFANWPTPPDVQEQEQIYTDILTQFKRRKVEPPPDSSISTNQDGDPDKISFTIRAFDLGADKPVNFIKLPQEAYPFLGLRGIRVLLREPELLRTQLRAVLAFAYNTQNRSRLRFMLPMVSTLEEVKSVHSILEEVDAELCAEKQSHGFQPNPNLTNTIELGVLIETPAAALMAAQLASIVDFLSIGTNDLTQYVLAADRTNPAVASLANPLHPAVLQLIDLIGRGGQVAKIPVSVCGMMASDPVAVPLLLGLGVTELSVTPTSVPLVKDRIRQCNLLQCRQIAEQALQCDSAQAVRSLLGAD